MDTAPPHVARAPGRRLSLIGAPAAARVCSVTEAWRIVRGGCGRLGRARAARLPKNPSVVPGPKFPRKILCLKHVRPLETRQLHIS